ncbi:MAG TPA: septum formation protein Maf [Firmicutes bacterium]|jgi:septum formation protein|nr:septum formation protein Maf [Bacillota bacterium]
MNLILASQSPRRKALLKKFGIPFSVHVLPSTEEEHGEPINVARGNATRKALPVSEMHPDCLVLAADTIVTLDERILGKPRDAQDAQNMLRFLSGREHEVTTCVVLCLNGQVVRSFSETTSVWFRRLDDDEIKGYIATGEPFDKAGAYGIQGFGGLLVKSIKGCYYNVVGLPMPRLAEHLRSFGIEVFSFK